MHICDWLGGNVGWPKLDLMNTSDSKHTPGITNYLSTTYRTYDWRIQEEFPVCKFESCALTGQRTTDASGKTLLEVWRHVSTMLALGDVGNLPNPRFQSRPIGPPRCLMGHKSHQKYTASNIVCRQVKERKVLEIACCNGKRAHHVLLSHWRI